MPLRAKEVGGRLVITDSRPTVNKNKFGAIKRVVGGIRFDSSKEAERYLALRDMERTGEITDLELQVPYKIFVQGELICEYRADFRYKDNETGQVVVEDVKSRFTASLPVYRLKKKLMRAVHKIEIQEV